jgi:AhpD family alkylhydroperoxidase
MRISAIEKPKGLSMKLAYAYSKRRLGRVITPMKVVYARVPKCLPLASRIAKYTEEGCSLPPALKLLVQTHVARLNECAFCVDIKRAIALRTHLDVSKLEALDRYRDDPAFTDAERAALAYVEEATRNKAVSDETFAELRNHFNETEIVEITLLNAVENFYNLVNRPLQIESDGLCALVPGLSRREPQTV